MSEQFAVGAFDYLLENFTVPSFTLTGDDFDVYDPISPFSAAQDDSVDSSVYDPFSYEKRQKMAEEEARDRELQQQFQQQQQRSRVQDQIFVEQQKPQQTNLIDPPKRQNNPFNTMQNEDRFKSGHIDASGSDDEREDVKQKPMNRIVDDDGDTYDPFASIQKGNAQPESTHERKQKRKKQQHDFGNDNEFRHFGEESDSKKLQKALKEQADKAKEKAKSLFNKGIAFITGKIETPEGRLGKNKNKRVNRDEHVQDFHRGNVFMDQKKPKTEQELRRMRMQQASATLFNDDDNDNGGLEIEQDTDMNDGFNNNGKEQIQNKNPFYNPPKQEQKVPKSGSGNVFDMLDQSNDENDMKPSGSANNLQMENSKLSQDSQPKDTNLFNPFEENSQQSSNNLFDPFKETGSNQSQPRQRQQSSDLYDPFASGTGNAAPPKQVSDDLFDPFQGPQLQQPPQPSPSPSASQEFFNSMGRSGSLSPSGSQGGLLEMANQPQRSSTIAQDDLFDFGAPPQNAPSQQKQNNDDLFDFSSPSTSQANPAPQRSSSRDLLDLYNNSSTPQNQQAPPSSNQKSNLLDFFDFQGAPNQPSQPAQQQKSYHSAAYDAFGRPPQQYNANMMGKAYGFQGNAPQYPRSTTPQQQRSQQQSQKPTNNLFSDINPF